MRYLLSGHSLNLAPELCNGCGRCEEVCPHGVFLVVRRKAEIVNRDGCMECGACRMNCATNAISVSSGVGCAQLIVNSMWPRKGTSERESMRPRTTCGCG